MKLRDRKSEVRGQRQEAGDRRLETGDRRQKIEHTSPLTTHHSPLTSPILEKTGTLVWVAALFAGLWLVGVGLNTQLYVGDEVFHYRLAKAIYAGPWRPLFDPLIHSSEIVKFDYVNAMLWHTLLAILWKLTGVSFAAAQAYHAGYYVLLVVGTYLLAKTLYDKEHGLISAGIVATAPMMVSFSVLFYMDIPVTALSVFGLFLIAKRRYRWAGAVLGLAFLTKRNAYLLAPGFTFLVFYFGNPGWKERVKRGLSFLVPLGGVVLPEFCFRYYKFGTLTGFTEIEPIYPNPPLDRNWLVAGVGNPLSWVQYFGIALLVLIGVYVVRRATRKRDLFLWISIAGYVFFYLISFRGWYDVRYLAPVTPFVAVLAAKGWSGLRHRYMKTLLVGIGLLQFGAVSYYVYVHRQIPPAVEEGFEYIRAHTLEEDRIMYPEVNLAEWTGRPMMWRSRISLVELPYLFWKANAEEAGRILNRYGIGYILVQKSRIYDDSRTHHLGGYPRSFVKKLPAFPFLKLVFENEALDLWKIGEKAKTEEGQKSKVRFRLKSTLP